MVNPTDSTPEPPPPGNSVLDVLAARKGIAPSVHLRDEADSSPGPVLRPVAQDRHGIAARTGKYLVQGEIAQGGVGTVFKGHDADLGREVAIKFLHARYKDDAVLLQRFVEEAQIGGQLQHPGVVPVYDLGLAGDRPYFSMKLVKGRTFAALLADRADPADGRRRMLAIFEQICQTMAYAHARGVVHRDLKPANVMIGAFGEVQVVDWGMGKVLRHGSPADEKQRPRPDVSIIETVRSGELGTKSLVGSIMGTPAYMPPEQALGQVEAMDERSDVFALGAILCEILTGLPVYLGDPVEQLRKAARGDVEEARARVRQSRADEAVVSLASDCLSPAPKDRPASAAEIATRIEKYLATVEQSLETARVRAQAAKRTQKLVAAVGLVVAAALVVSLFFWRKAETQRRAAEAAAEAARISSGRERTARELADERLVEASRAQELERAARQDADAKALQLRRALDGYDLLANVVKLREAVAAEADLYPAWPPRAPAMRAWLNQQAQPLTAALPGLEATLTGLRARAGTGADSLRFATKSDQFLHDTLARLVDDLHVFAAPTTGLVAAVERRLAWADAVVEETIGKYRREWDAAIADIATNPRYGGLHLAPQLDLVPLRPDPTTRLWEFVHVRSGTPGKAMPQRNPDSRQLEVTEDSGLVFVLLPAGSFEMGAQSSDPNAVNFDASALPNEKPVHTVQLAAFFVSKYEMTQAQWRRLSEGGEPSGYKPGTKPGDAREVTWSDPVENVSWSECDALLERHGLELPTEAQWEYACRAGSHTPWNTGADAGSLRGAANLADLAAQRGGTQWTIEPGFDDGFVVHAPVGSFAPNGFGLFDMHGNVWEWCRDGSGNYQAAKRAGDGLRLEADAERRVSRGGSFAFPAADARSSYRFFDMAGTRDINLGLRPARAVLDAQ